MKECKHNLVHKYRKNPNTEHLAKYQELADAEPEQSEEDEDIFGDDDDYLYARADSLYYRSKLEDLEAPLAFRDFLETLKNNNPEGYAALTELISEENKALLEGVIQRCEVIQSMH